MADIIKEMVNSNTVSTDAALIEGQESCQLLSAHATAKSADSTARCI